MLEPQREHDRSSVLPDTRLPDPATSMASPDASSARPRASSPRPGTNSASPDVSSADPNASSADPDRRPSETLARRERAQAIASITLAVQLLADEIASRPNLGSSAAPREDLRRLAAQGLFTAPLPVRLGGLGLGSEPGGHLPLLRILAAIGGGDLALGRLYEGHVNALILIVSFGTQQQLEQAAEDAHQGRLFAVWNTGRPEPMRVEAAGSGYRLHGAKTFASGAAFVDRPIVTAEIVTAEGDSHGWQMTLPRMESPAVACAVRVDRSSWQPLGMESSESFGIEFAGASLDEDDLLGEPGDFYREPLFHGGAIRFAAVQAGAVLRLHRMFAAALEQQARGEDPYQLARLGEIALEAQQAVLWIERAAAAAEENLRLDADKLARERMLEAANMTRLAIERLATSSMNRIAAGVGARGLLAPSRFERVLRDLTMYLRQPAPDQTLAEVGRASLRKHRLRSDGAENGLWQQTRPSGSLPAAYFQNLYKISDDPWNFEQSEYEAAKYQDTLDSLPYPRYRNALEIGCSIGVLTERLASRCDALLSVDVSARALKRAGDRCSGLRQVQFECMQVPNELPAGEFDLVVVSEVAYYWQREDLEQAIALLARQQPAGGHLILVHFTGPVPDYPLTADEVHELWLERPEWSCLEEHTHDSYRLTLLERVEDLSTFETIAA